MSDIANSIDRFFLDLIGTAIPGSVLLLGLWITFGQPQISGIILVFPPKSISDWIFWVIVGYIFGHAVLNLLEVKKVKSIVERIRNKYLKQERNNKRLIVPIKNWLGVVAESDYSKAELRYYRNIAMTIAPDNSELIYRFKAISKMNIGVALALSMLGVIWILLIVLNIFAPISIGLPAMNTFWQNVLTIVLLLLPVPLFIIGYDKFDNLSFYTPFHVAAAKVRSSEIVKNSEES